MDYVKVEEAIPNDTFAENVEHVLVKPLGTALTHLNMFRRFKGRF